MKVGPLVTAVVALLAMGAVVAAFMSNASPYVTVAQAKQLRGDRMHLAGDILPGTLHIDVAHAEVTFQVKDANGEVMTIVNRGEIPANMGEATKVVAIGGMQGDQFVSEQLLLKCPSRYESKKPEFAPRT